ncbi:MAG: hypothetical protein QM796_13360 [Chthoniobacteraceae bacterium]
MDPAGAGESRPFCLALDPRGCLLCRSRVYYAAYGGIYIAASLLWMWTVEHTAPDRFDLIGAACCLVGTGVILFAPRLQ